MLNRKSEFDKQTQPESSSNNHSDLDLFIDAIKSGNTEAVRLYSAQNNHCGINKQTNEIDSKTALHYAIEYFHIGAIQILLQNTSIDVNCRDINGRTPLVYAALFAQNEGLSHRHDFTFDGGFSEAASRSLAKFTDWTKIIHLLICAGADVNVTNNRGESLLRMLILDGITHFNNVQTCVAKMLIDAGARDKQVKIDISPRRPLIAACCLSVDDSEIIQILCKAGEDIDSKDRSNNNTPALAYAVSTRELGFVRHMIYIGADVNACDDNGKTVLMNAVYRDTTLSKNSIIKIDIIKYLCSLSNINLEAKNDKGETAAEIAKNSNEQEVYSIIIDAINRKKCIAQTCCKDKVQNTMQPQSITPPVGRRSKRLREKNGFFNNEKSSTISKPVENNITFTRT